MDCWRFLGLEVLGVPPWWSRIMAGERPPDTAAAACLENFRQYRDLAAREVERVRRNLNGLSDDDKASLIRKPEEQVKAMEEVGPISKSREVNEDDPQGQ
eukprot:symbB.v1.2.001624.t1/scaffold80.1/size342472/11